MNWVPLISKLGELIKDGRLPGAARDTVIITVLSLGSGYIARMDRRFESIEVAISKMSESVVETSNAIQVSAETMNWHGKEIQRHSRDLERQWDMLTRLEEGIRNGGLEIPKRSAKKTPELPQETRDR